MIDHCFNTSTNFILISWEQRQKMKTDRVCFFSLWSSICMFILNSTFKQESFMPELKTSIQTHFKFLCPPFGGLYLKCFYRHLHMWSLFDKGRTGRWKTRRSVALAYAAFGICVVCLINRREMLFLIRLGILLFNAQPMVVLHDPSKRGSLSFLHTHTHTHTRACSHTEGGT